MGATMVPKWSPEVTENVHKRVLKVSTVLMCSRMCFFTIFDALAPLRIGCSLSTFSFIFYFSTESPENIQNALQTEGKSPKHVIEKLIEIWMRFYFEFEASLIPKGTPKITI